MARSDRVRVLLVVLVVAAVAVLLGSWGGMQ